MNGKGYVMPNLRLPQWLPCAHCRDGWRLVEYRGLAIEELCDVCDGKGAQICVESRCPELAVREFVERGEIYPLCAEHFAQWLADTESEA